MIRLRVGREMENRIDPGKLIGPGGAPLSKVAHDDGRVALCVPCPDPYDYFPWQVIEPTHPNDTLTEAVWQSDEYVAGPDWQDAVIVPLPEPTGTLPSGRPRWEVARDSETAEIVPLLDGVPVYLDDCDLSTDEARQLAAALLAAAEYVDRR